MTENPALAALRYHVSGAIARGEAEPIIAREPSPRRMVILGGPGGYLATCGAGRDWRADSRFRGWIELGRVNLPRRVLRAIDGEPTRCGWIILRDHALAGIMRTHEIDGGTR